VPPEMMLIDACASCADYWCHFHISPLRRFSFHFSSFHFAAIVVADDIFRAKYITAPSFLRA
jgi:hypothetical protein